MNSESVKTYEASASSLIDLKAELYRKREAFNQEKLDRALGKVTHGGTVKTNNKNDIWARKNAGVAERNAKDCTGQKIDEDEEEAVRKAKEALERKARLYEFLSKGNTVKGKEDGQLFLVNFEKKAIDEALVKKAERTEAIGPLPATNHEKQHTSTDHSTILQSEPATEWLEAPEEDDVGPIHYQNVQYDEIREHGTGYFAFSQDEEERKRQMENLQRMTEQTNKQRLEREKLKEKKKALLKARLQKVRQRKSIAKTDEEISGSGSDSDDRDGLLSQLPLDEIPLPPSQQPPVDEETVTRKQHIRPWDKGKISKPWNLPPPPKFKKVSQEAWIEERRGERHQEFAPPSAYDKPQKWKPPRKFKERNRFKWLHQKEAATPSEPDSYVDADSKFSDHLQDTQHVQSEAELTDSISEALAYFRNQSNVT